MSDSFPIGAFDETWGWLIIPTLRDFRGFNATVDREEQGLRDTIIKNDISMRMIKAHLKLANPLMIAGEYDNFLRSTTSHHWQLREQLKKAFEALHRQVDP